MYWFWCLTISAPGSEGKPWHCCFHLLFRSEGHYFSVVCLECTPSTYLPAHWNHHFFTLSPIKDIALWAASRHCSRTITILNFKNWRGWEWRKNHYMVCSSLHHFLWRSDRDLHLNKRKTSDISYITEGFMGLDSIWSLCLVFRLDFVTWL